LRVRPFLSGRDYHALHHENDAFRFEADTDGGCVTWHPYHGVSSIHAFTNGTYAPDAQWYRNFSYEGNAPVVSTLSRILRRPVCSRGTSHVARPC
jgi:hypothetical protein